MGTNDDARDPSARGVVRLVETGDRRPVASVSAIVQFMGRALLHAERPTNLSCLCRNGGTSRCAALVIRIQLALPAIPQRIELHGALYAIGRSIVGDRLDEACACVKLQLKELTALLITFAYNTGYVSRSSFVRVFRKAYGGNPTDNQPGSSLECQFAPRPALRSQ